MGTFHRRITAALLAFAAHKQLSWRDEDGAKKDLYTGLYAYGVGLASGSKFKSGLKAAAKTTAASAKSQVAKAIGMSFIETDLTAQEATLAGGIQSATFARVSDSLDRAEDVFSKWAAEEADVGVLETALDEGLAGIAGKALSTVGLAFASAWADMNKTAQVDNDVEQYVWVTRHDERVRGIPGGRYPGYHWELENTTHSWAGKPPLSADKSTSGEACHPGEDTNCRCIGAPIN